MLPLHPLTLLEILKTHLFWRGPCMRHLVTVDSAVPFKCRSYLLTNLRAFCDLLYIHSTKANSATHPSGVGKWVPASAGKAKAGMVHSVSGWMRGVQVKLWDPLRTRAISKRLRGVFTTSRYKYTFTFTCEGQTDVLWHIDFLRFRNILTYLLT